MAKYIAEILSLFGTCIIQISSELNHAMVNQG